MRFVLGFFFLLSAAVDAADAPFVMDLPFVMDDIEIGTATVGLKDMQMIFIKADSFEQIASGHLDPATLSALLSKMDDDRDIPINGFHDVGLEISFNPATLQVVLSPTEAQRRLKNVSSSRSASAPAGESVAGLSSYINYSVNQGYVHQSQFSDTGAEPLRGFLDGGINLGVLGPVTLEWEATYDEDEDAPWARGETRLVVDDQSNAIRYAAGDVFYQSGEFQGAPGLLGLSAERRYQVLQPFNIITSTGQQTFTVQRTSRVEVFVNGILQSTQRLAPGRYNLSDFSFSEGLNDIELVITDELGRVERVSFSLFLDSTLLKRGISEFSVNAGYRREDSFQRGIEYDYDRPAASGFYRYGIADNLTTGIQLQGEEKLQVYGIEAVIGTPVGVFGTTASTSDSYSYGEAAAGAARWKLEIPVEGSTRPLTLQLASVFNERNYLSLGQEDPSASFRFQHQARLSSSLPGNVYFGLSVRQAEAYLDRAEDETGVSLSLSRRFRWFNANIFVDHVQSDEDETSVLAGISIPLGIGRQVRGTYDRLRETTGIQYSDFPVNVVNDWSGSVEVERVTLDDEEHRVSGALNYTANRFIAGVTHDYSQEGFFEGETEERTLAELSGALVVADGQFAVARPVFDAFALVARHESLADANILVNETSQGPTAIADDFGPAVIPSMASYREQDIYWRADNMPPGYDMGDTRRGIVPTYRSGSNFVAGSGANIIAMGTIVSSDDIGLKAGTVRPADERDFPERQTFTNRKGRFVVQKLEPGVYEMDFGAGRKAQFTVPSGKVGYMDLGTVTLGEE